MFCAKVDVPAKASVFLFLFSAVVPVFKCSIGYSSAESGLFMNF